MASAPHPFTLRQLQYVAAVADELSFRRAADRCHVSQPSLSSQVAQIEGALGVRLFERANKRVLVTAAGRDIVERARRLLVDADEIVRTAQRIGNQSSPVAQAELRGQELFLLDDGHCFREQALEACGGARAREGEFRATSLSTLVQMVSGGAGITLIPTLAVDAEAKRARLHVRPLAGPSAHRTVALIWRKGSSIEPALHAIAALLREAYPGGADPPVERERGRGPGVRVACEELHVQWTHALDWLRQWTSYS